MVISKSNASTWPENISTEYSNILQFPTINKILRSRSK